MRMNKLAWDELVSRRSSKVGRLSITELRDSLVFTIKNGYSTRKVRNEHQIIVEVYMARLTNWIFDKLNMLAFEIKILKTVIASISNTKHLIVLVSLVNPKTMRTGNLARLRSRTNYRLNILTVFGIPMNVARATWLCTNG